MRNKLIITFFILLAIGTIIACYLSGENPLPYVTIESFILLITSFADDEPKTPAI